MAIKFQWLLGKNIVVNTRLWRWFLIHVLLALFPFLASFAVSLFQDSGNAGHFGAGEILFFALMLSSIAAGDVLEWLPLHGLTNALMLFIAFFLGCFAASLGLYAMYVYHNTLNRGGGEKVLVYSLVLAGSCVVVGTLLELAFWDTERKKNGERKVAARG